MLEKFPPILIGPGDFCRLVDMPQRRFDKIRERERAASDVAAALGDDDIDFLPISPTEPTVHGRFDGFDAVKMRAVIVLERTGIAFGQACRFIRSAGLSPLLMFPDDEDQLATIWTLPDGSTRRVCGSARDISRAMPAAPMAAASINLSAVRDDVAKRASVQLGLIIRGCNFYRESDR